MIIPTIRSDPTESNQTERRVTLTSPVSPLTWGFSEPEVGVEPTTFRLRGVEHSSSRYRCMLFLLLRSRGLSSQYASGLGRYSRWNDRGNDQTAQGTPQVTSTF